MANVKKRIQGLLDVAGPSYAEAAGITLKDTPMPLYQLLVLATLLSARINSEIAVAAARELFQAGCRSPKAMLDASWQQRVDALGRAGYRRYDESTATRLGDGAQLLQEQYQGDLRRLAEAGDQQSDRTAELLQQFPGIGPLGAQIFLREAQAVWPWLQPYLDDGVADRAAGLGLPRAAAELARAAGTKDLSALTAAIVRAGSDKKLRERLPD